MSNQKKDFIYARKGEQFETFTHDQWNGMPDGKYGWHQVTEVPEEVRALYEKTEVVKVDATSFGAITPEELEVIKNEAKKSEEGRLLAMQEIETVKTEKGAITKEYENTITDLRDQIAGLTHNIGELEKSLADAKTKLTSANKQIKELKANANVKD